MDNELAIVLTSFSTFLYPALIFIFSMVLKDIGTEFAAGLGFYFDSEFNKGDEVYIAGNKAIIDKIGVRRTIFAVTFDDGSIRQRYVLNTRIKLLMLEKERT